MVVIQEDDDTRQGCAAIAVSGFFRYLVYLILEVG